MARVAARRDELPHGAVEADEADVVALAEHQQRDRGGGEAP